MIFIKNKINLKKYIKNELNFNIFFNFFFKGFSILISFLLVPTMLNYLKTEEYGLWILILSITGWVYTFDIGIGNGLKNKIAEYLARKKYEEIKEAIITSYFFIFIISLILFIVISISLKFLNLNNLLQIYFLSKRGIFQLLVLNMGFVCLNFTFSLCNNIFIGSQKTYLSAINNALSQLLFFIFLVFLFLLKKKSIFYLSIIYGTSISISHLILTICYFHKNKDLKPNFNNFNINKIKGILNVGGKIFIMQIAGLIIFSTDSFIITNFLGPEKVAEYNIVYKFFSIPLILINLICTPVWSHSTKEYYNRNYLWFKKILKKLNLLFMLTCLGMFLMVILGQKLIYFWTIYKIKPSFSLIVITAIAVLLTCYSNIYSAILLGINEVNLPMYLAIIQAVLNIILSYIFIKHNLGINGVILATCICMIITSFELPKILKRKLKKIQNKKI